MAPNDKSNQGAQTALVAPPVPTSAVAPASVNSTSAEPATSAQPTVDTIGTQTDTISVALSTRFLEHFSEQLYSSPQKAFEELISNSWDAGAEDVDVRIADNLESAEATLAVFDNGVSMDTAGLTSLWLIAASPKKNLNEQFGRPLIGKFGIGKLATYVLANKLTYICKASDGKIRRVTMDYAGPELKQQGEDQFINDLKLKVFEVTLEDVNQALKKVSGGDAISNIIANGPPQTPADFEDEFCGNKAQLAKQTTGTWTIAILSDLKPAGRELKIGVLKRMLSAALPIGSELRIHVNGAPLTSAKLDTPVLKEWKIGPGLGLDSFELDEANASDPNAESKKTTIKITYSNSPSPNASIDGLGAITGRVRLYQDRITEGKSEIRGISNGFHVNVLGRVINQADPSFGEENLSHAAWARFRMTVRVDGLNPLLTTNREQFKDTREIRVFRAFLRRVFNLIRTHYDANPITMPDGGDVLVKSLGVLSLSPLRNVVSDTLAGDVKSVPGLLDQTGITNPKEKRESWLADTSNHIAKALSEVKYEKLDGSTLVRFRLADNAIVIDREHPFAQEHFRTKAEKELLLTVAMVDLLADVYALDIGVPPDKLASIRDYRDRLMRFRVMQRRQSGVHIAQLLLKTQHESHGTDYKQLETAVSDALSYLGFQVKDLAKSGQPEGLASAFPTPTASTPTEKDPEPPLYSFSFDAKSAAGENAKTGNIKLDGVVEHRKKYGATYALIVAPGYQKGALDERCKDQKVTPITAAALGRLLHLTAKYGAIPLTKLREMFDLFTPESVEDWVEKLGPSLEKARPLTLDIFLGALEHLKGKIPDVLPAGTVALICRTKFNAHIKAADVLALAQGLAVLVPDLVAVNGDKIVVNASAGKVAEAVGSQLETLAAEDAGESSTHSTASLPQDAPPEPAPKKPKPPKKEKA